MNIARALLSRGAGAISPTAYYTGEVWVRHGLAPVEFRTRPGVALYTALEPAMTASRLVGGPTFEALLLARHRVLDELLEQAIEEGRVGQVVELAAGMSPRGLRFAERYGDRLTYVETDLPEMAERKRARLAAMGRISGRHQVEAVDVLATGGPGSLGDLLAGLDRSQGVAVISEGLLNYLPSADVRRLWHLVAEGLAEFPAGLYLSDLHLGGENAGAFVQLGQTLLGAFVRGRIHLHFETEDVAVDVLRGAGFTSARLHRPAEFPAPDGRRPAPGADLVRVVEGRTR